VTERSRSISFSSREVEGSDRATVISYDDIQIEVVGLHSSVNDKVGK